MCEYSRYSDYDDFAWVYNKHWGDNFTPAALTVLKKLVFSRIPVDARILDLCCGTGQLAQALSERGYAVTGIDGSQEMLRYARKMPRQPGSFWRMPALSTSLLNMIWLSPCSIALTM